MVAVVQKLQKEMSKFYITLGTMLFAACAPKFPALTPDEFEQTIAGPDVQLVDVRTPEEYEQGHIAGAMNIDWKSDTFADDASGMLDKSKTVALYCKGGRRSHAAAGRVCFLSVSCCRACGVGRLPQRCPLSMRGRFAPRVR